MGRSRSRILIAWALCETRQSLGWWKKDGPRSGTLTVVAETYDGGLNDINGFHVTRDHALDTMRNASGGSVAEGVVGGGTSMVCNGFKGESVRRPGNSRFSKSNIWLEFSCSATTTGEATTCDWVGWT